MSRSVYEIMEGLWDFAWRMFVLRHIWAFDRTNTQMWKRHWLKFVITTRNPKEPLFLAKEGESSFFMFFFTSGFSKI